MAQQEKIYYLTKEQYNTLWNNGAKDGSFEHEGTTYTYEENATYYVKEDTEYQEKIVNGTIIGKFKIDSLGVKLIDDNGDYQNVITMNPGGVGFNNTGDRDAYIWGKNVIVEPCGAGVVNLRRVKQLSAPKSSNDTQFGNGSAGQVLTSNGSSVYWSTPSGGSGLDTSKTLTLSNATPIELTGFGTGTYNKGVFVCNQTDKFGVECPRETDSSSAAIVPFRVGVRGGGLGNFETGNASVSNLTVNDKLYGPQIGSNPRNQYDSGLYFFNCDPNSTSSYNFGLYQWVDKFQFTTRTASDNGYKTTAFEIDGNTGVTSFSATPTVNGTSVSLSGHTHGQYLTKTNVTQSQIAANTQVVIANPGCYIFIPKGTTGGSLYHGIPSSGTFVSDFTGPVIMHSGTPGTVHYFVARAYKILQQAMIFFTVPGRLITIT